MDLQHRIRGRVLPHRLGPVPRRQANTRRQQRLAVPQPQQLGDRPSERQSHAEPFVHAGTTGQTVAESKPRLQCGVRISHDYRSNERVHDGAAGASIQKEQY